MKSATQRQVFFSAIIIFIALCVFSIIKKVPAPLSAQSQPAVAVENSIMVVPVQIDRETHGVAMVDTVAQTLWIYKLDSRGPAFNRLELFAARSWQYDRMLQKYNTAEPKPEQVKMLLESLAQPKDIDNKPKDVNEKQKDVNEN